MGGCCASTKKKIHTSSSVHSRNKQFNEREAGELNNYFSVGDQGMKDVLNRTQEIKEGENFAVGPEIFRGERKIMVNDRYEQLEMIGRGAFGDVRKARDKITGKIRAMKTVLKSQCQRSELIVDEIEILKQIDHPNIARFYEFYQDDTFYYLIMEYCQGGDLLSQGAYNNYGLNL